MPRSTERPPGVGAAAGWVLRFDKVERAAHWATALLVLVLVATGLVLYVPSLSLAVGRRLVIEDIHLYCGVAVFAPLALAAIGPWGRRLRADLASMSRLTAGEREWLRSRGRRARSAVGKFNPGQKLNASSIAGLLAVLFFTGLVLRWGNFVAVGFRTGATFVHDWFALAAVLLIAGHVVMAITHPAALRAMVGGSVRRSWVARHAPAWRASAGGAPGDAESTGDVAAESTGDAASTGGAGQNIDGPVAGALPEPEITKALIER